MSEPRKYVYGFGGETADAGARAKELLGGKGANLAEMSRLGVPVPPGFTLSTEVCTHYYAHERGPRFPERLDAEVRTAMQAVERALAGPRFGDENDPLLVSVRSGARVSMPGMMDTVLNLGLNDRTVLALAKKSGNARFAWDSYRRFVQMYGDVVLGLKPTTRTESDPFEAIIEARKQERRVMADSELDEHDLQFLVGKFKDEIRARAGVEFPEDPWAQLWGAIGAVFGSWNNPRAITYRRMYNIPSEWGTAVTVQAMVFGNLGDDSATGVAFTRDPSTGEKRFFGEFLVNAQGEDVVAGIRTPRAISGSGAAEASLAKEFPEAYAELERIYLKLESHFRDMQDIEFTIQRGRLWMLQTRSGKRSARAMVRLAVEMVAEQLITIDEAILRMDPGKLEELLHPMLDPMAAKKVLARGLPASPGAAVGKIVFHADDAVALAQKGEATILVRVETSPEDIHGMQAARGIVTARGGMTSHAAVVARGMGKCCVAGCSALAIDYAKSELTVDGNVLRAGDTITLDGSTGEVMLGAVPMTAPKLDDNWHTLMRWVDERRTMRVRTNADTPTDAQTARNFGAEGIGLCRTEHMFFGDDKILAVRQMILSDTEAERRRALEKILPMQRADFVGIFRAMDGLAVTIRLLDPPLHEFLPTEDSQLEALARELGVSVATVKARATALHEANPMLGHRGSRLGLSYPEIFETQVRAIVEAAVEAKRAGVHVIPEIMLPLIGHERELEPLVSLVRRVADGILEAAGVDVHYLVGTMIELPRACLAAEKLAQTAEFFSFGTNDLTQTALGVSRDDAASFLGHYVELGIYGVDPFVSIDEDGVGELMKIAIERGRRARPDIKLGICGEHGGDPASIALCQRLGLDYVSCSPFRVPIARLAAAKAALAFEKTDKTA